ncbi:MAG: PHP domain-containing protein [Actinomycetota bacterium]|nr:PHP domain-containing protein [Actinomycetota bacterium]
MTFDLHIHSTASDGSLSPEEIVRVAAHGGMAAIAITDHDSVAGIPSALTASAAAGIRLIPGVELSAVHEGLDVHILGYFVDHNDLRLAERLSELRELRRARAADIVGALYAAGYHLAIDEVLMLAEGGSVGRSHVARALVERGHAADVADAFERFIGRGRPFYVPKPVARPAHVVKTIRDAGGLAVLAHPGITGIDDAIDELVAAGLSGLEAYHAEHTQEQRDHYARLAAQRGLLVTGGSDYHGPKAPGAEIGSVAIPDEALEALLAAAPSGPSAAPPTVLH